MGGVRRGVGTHSATLAAGRGSGGKAAGATSSACQWLNRSCRIDLPDLTLHKRGCTGAADHASGRKQKLVSQVGPAAVDSLLGMQAWLLAVDKVSARRGHTHSSSSSISAWLGGSGLARGPPPPPRTTITCRACAARRASADKPRMALLLLLLLLWLPLLSAWPAEGREQGR